MLDALHQAYFEDGRGYRRSRRAGRHRRHSRPQPTTTAAQLAGDTKRDEVLSAVAEVRQLGITGVPFFVFDRAISASGAQPRPSSSAGCIWPRSKRSPSGRIVLANGRGRALGLKRPKDTQSHAASLSGNPCGQVDKRGAKPAGGQGCLLLGAPLPPVRRSADRCGVAASAAALTGTDYCSRGRPRPAGIGPVGRPRPVAEGSLIFTFHGPSIEPGCEGGTWPRSICWLPRLQDEPWPRWSTSWPLP